MNSPRAPAASSGCPSSSHLRMTRASTSTWLVSLKRYTLVRLRWASSSSDASVSVRSGRRSHARRAAERAAPTATAPKMPYRTHCAPGKPRVMGAPLSWAQNVPTVIARRWRPYDKACSGSRRTKQPVSVWPLDTPNITHPGEQLGHHRVAGSPECDHILVASARERPTVRTHAAALVRPVTAWLRVCLRVGAQLHVCVTCCCPTHQQDACVDDAEPQSVPYVVDPVAVV